MKQDDILWKALLEDIFDDFLLFFFKEKAEIFDLKDFEFLDKELDSIFPSAEEQHPRFVDKLVKVFTKQGEEKWVLVHIEIQGYNDANFAKRMFTYFYRLLDKYDRHVTSIAIFTGSNKNFMPGEYHYNFMGIENIFRYNTYKIIDQDVEELDKSDNPFALVILIALLALQKNKLLEEEILNLKKDILYKLVRKQIPPEKIKAIMGFLHFYVRFDNPENNAKFEEAFREITGKNKETMGIEEFLLTRAKTEGRREGKKEGQEEGKASVIRGLLKNTGLSAEEIALSAGVTVAFVKQIKALPS